MLCRQGRMIREWLFFPIKHFYAGKFGALGLPRSVGAHRGSGTFLSLRSKIWRAFRKTNRYEAQIVAGLAKEVYLAHEEELIRIER